MLHSTVEYGVNGERKILMHYKVYRVGSPYAHLSYYTLHEGNETLKVYDGVTEEELDAFLNEGVRP